MIPFDTARRWSPVRKAPLLNFLEEFLQNSERFYISISSSLEILNSIHLCLDGANNVFRYLFSMSVMTRQGPTSIRLIFSRGCFRVETSSGLISPRSPCVVSLVLRMSHLSRNNESSVQEESEPKVPKPFRSALLEKPLYSKVPSLKHFSRLVINRYNLRNFTEQRDSEYIRAYPYPI